MRAELVLALPRGGVPVAAPVAAALGVPLDILCVRKLAAPGREEFGVGAIASGGIRVLDARALEQAGVTAAALEEVERKAWRELARQERAYRGDRPPPRLSGRSVVLVDDGLATGGTMRAAILAARRGGVSRISVAVPVGPSETVEALREEADEVVVLETPPVFRAVGAWYADFSPVEDGEVLAALFAPRPDPRPPAGVERMEVRLDVEEGELEAVLSVPPGARGVVAFLHGSGSSRRSVRNGMVAEGLIQRGLATLLLDLLTPRELALDAHTEEFRFDLPRLAHRAERAAEWLADHPATAGLPVGLFGSSTGAAAALLAARSRGGVVRAVVSRGGRPDLAREALAAVEAPTLLIVGGRDTGVLEFNRRAFTELAGPKALVVVEDAAHLFEEAGALDEVTRLAADWFLRHLPMGPAGKRARAPTGAQAP